MGPAPAGLNQLQDIFQRLINLGVGFAFIALVIMLMWGGIKLLTSGGEQKALQSASGVFTWSLLGILFLVIAWLILLVIKSFTGVDVLHFCIGFAPFCA